VNSYNNGLGRKAERTVLMRDEILQGRYAIERQLRKQAGRQTLIARDLATQELVVIKLLTVLMLVIEKVRVKLIFSIQEIFRLWIELLFWF